MKFDVLLDSCKTLRVPTDTQEAMLSCLLRHNKLFYLAGGALQPKHHSMLHLAQRSLFCGHPKSYHTYHDEVVKGLVKQNRMQCTPQHFCRDGAVQSAHPSLAGQGSGTAR